MRTRLRQVGVWAAVLCLSTPLPHEIAAKAMGVTRTTPREGDVLERLSSEHARLATRRVAPDIGNRGDLPWMPGQILVEVIVDDRGKVTEARALYGDSTLVDAAVRAAQQWEFRPFVVDGIPHRVRTAIAFDLTAFPDGINPRNVDDAVAAEIALRSESPLALYNAGWALDTFGNKHSEAIKYFQKALAVKPDWALAWYALGHAHYGLDKYEQAIHAYERALELDPALYEAAFEIGWCHDRMKPRIDSSAAFERAARLAKSAQGRLAAMMNLTGSHARAGRMRESADARFEMVREMRRFVGVDPLNFYDVPRDAYDVAKNYEAIREYSLMAEAFRLAMETSAESYFGMLSRVELAEHLLTTGREAEGRVLFETVLTLVRSSERRRGAARDRDTQAVRRYWNAWALLGLARTGEAVGEARKAVGLKPDWDRARYLLGRIYERLGERAKAAEEFRRSGLVDEGEIRKRTG